MNNRDENDIIKRIYLDSGIPAPVVVKWDRGWEVLDADAKPIPAPIQMAAKPLELGRETKPPEPVKFSKFCKDHFPKASGLARRAARQAIKSNHHWGRGLINRRKHNEEK